MSDKEIEYNGKKFGETTTIRLKLSTLVWILSGLSALATMGYFDMKSDISSQKSLFEDEKMEYKQELRDLMKNELRDLRDRDDEMTEDIGEIKGDIKVILDRSLRNNNTHVPVPTPTSLDVVVDTNVTIPAPPTMPTR